MKKSCLLLLISAAGLVACTNNTLSSENVSSSVASASSEAALQSISLSQTSYTLSITSTVANPSVTLTVTCNPTTFANENVTWTSSNAEVATVNNGVVTGLSKGTATITATVLNKTATCEITVQKSAFDNIIDKNITELGEEALNRNLYRISGVVEEINSVSHEFHLADVGGSGKYATMRYIGSPSTKDADFTITDDEITYSREAANVFDSLNIAEGKYATIVGVYFKYANVWYFDGYLENITDGSEHTYTASVSVDDSTHGSATLSKTTGIAWNEEVEITATPASGYNLATITCNGINVNKNSEGKYIFNARAVNAVAVTFAEAKTSVVTLDFTTYSENGVEVTESKNNPRSEQYMTLKNDGSNDPKYYYNATPANRYLLLVGNNNNETNGNSLDTIADFGGNINKVVINAYGGRAGVFFGVFGSNDAYLDDTTARTWTQIGENITLEAVSKEYTVEVLANYKYIRIQVLGSSVVNKQMKITSVTYYAE